MTRASDVTKKSSKVPVKWYGCVGHIKGDRLVMKSCDGIGEGIEKRGRKRKRGT